MSYRFIEKPVRRINSRRLAFSLLLLMVLTGWIGSAIYARDGIPSRYPQSIVDLIKPIDFDFNRLARYGECHFDPRIQGNHAEVGKNGCIEEAPPLLLLWGDSYAAALYPGLKALQATHSFGIGQVTTYGYPPVIPRTVEEVQAEPPQREAWNQSFLKLVDEKKPAIILMHSFWTAYWDHQGLREKLSQTITQLQSLSQKSRIIVLGPVPQWGDWDEGLPRFMYRYWDTHGHQSVPEYMSLGLSPVPEAADQFLELEIPKMGATYVSAYKALCRQEGCLTRVGPRPQDLTAIDQGHLSAAGAAFLIKAVSAQVLNLPSVK